MVEGLLIVRKIEKEKVVQVLQSAILAPSGSNTQPWAFIIIESEETKEKLSIADHNQKWMITAPVFIVCSRYSLSYF